MSFKVKIMLSKCVGNVTNTAIRYNLCTFNGFKPLRTTDFRHIKNTYQFSRQFNAQNSRSKTDTKIKTDNSAESIAYYSMAVVVLCGGLSFAAVPLYRLFCQVICAITFLLLVILFNRNTIRTFRPQDMAEQSMRIMILVKWSI